MMTGTTDGSWWRAMRTRVATMAQQILGEADRGRLERDNRRTDDDNRGSGNEASDAAVVGIRSPWTETLGSLSELTPARLRTILDSLRSGASSLEYLEAAELLEEAGGHYRSVLGDRKLGVAGLEPVVEPRDDSAQAAELADEVRMYVTGAPQWPDLLDSLLDAFAKGYSVTRVHWRTDEMPWRPIRYEWMDPRWFQYDRRTGRELALLADDGVTRRPLRAGIHLVHEPPLKQGLPLRAGLALPALWYNTIIHTDIVSWIAFIQTFGYPLRVGKYPRSATKADIEVLKRAIRNMGRDMGAVMPDSMVMEIIAAIQPGGSTEHYERLARWCNQELSKLVIGQTGTADGTPGVLGNRDDQQEVRRDIRVADARHVEVPINRLVQWFCGINHGTDAPAPRVRLPVPVPEDIGELANALDKLLPHGLRVRERDIYQRLRLTRPSEDDDVLEARQPAPAPAPALQRRRLPWPALHDQRPRGVPDPVEEALAELLAGGDWEPITRPIYEAVQTWAEEMPSLDEARRRLPELMDGIDRDRLVQRLAADLLRARGLGDAGFDEP